MRVVGGVLVYPLLELWRTLGEFVLSCKAMERKYTARFILMREAQESPTKVRHGAQSSRQYIRKFLLNC